MFKSLLLAKVHGQSSFVAEANFTRSTLTADDVINHVLTERTSEKLASQRDPDMLLEIIMSNNLHVK